jgi:hypothetical protein
MNREVYRKMSSPTIQELRQMPDGELIRRHDELAKNANTGTAYYLDELARRQQSSQNDIMLRYTRQMLDYTGQIKWWTVIILLATLIQLGVAIFKH